MDKKMELLGWAGAGLLAWLGKCKGLGDHL